MAELQLVDHVIGLRLPVPNGAETVPIRSVGKLRRNTWANALPSAARSKGSAVCESGEGPCAPSPERPAWLAAANTCKLGSTPLRVPMADISGAAFAASPLGRCGWRGPAGPSPRAAADLSAGNGDGIDGQDAHAGERGIRRAVAAEQVLELNLVLLPAWSRHPPAPAGSNELRLRVDQVRWRQRSEFDLPLHVLVKVRATSVAFCFALRSASLAASA